MIIFVKLILAHLIGDFVLQTDSWVEEKERQGIKSIKFYLHGLIHGALVLLFLWDLNLWPVALTVAITHIAIDFVKLTFQREKNIAGWFLFDQFLHLLSLFIIWLLFFKPEINIAILAENQDLWIYITAILFLTVVCGIVIQILLGSWTKSIDTVRDISLPNAGRYIGIMERILVFIFVVTGHWEAIGFLVAAKSVFRFGDLKDSRNRKLTEYVLIGTLLSFGIAIVTGIIVLALTD
ncbi:MAG: DUF3307 domain-containing protein [Fermentimonas sp.]|nr:DUF3307 domain-containing protein [Fermentimonas sp.]